MGTTQRINPGVTNEPNWGDLSNSITQLAKTLEQQKKLDDEEAKENVEDKKENDDGKLELVYEELCDIKRLVVAIGKHLYSNKELLSNQKVNRLYQDLQKGIRYMKNI